MQLCNVTVRNGGSLLHTVPRLNVTPAEILILQRIHGEDAVVDIRPTRVDKTIRPEILWDQLVRRYERNTAFAPRPGDERKSLMAELFPGAVKKLPATLDEIGLGHLAGDAPIEKKPRQSRRNSGMNFAPEPEVPEVTDENDTDAPPAEADETVDDQADA